MVDVPMVDATRLTFAMLPCSLEIDASQLRPVKYCAYALFGSPTGNIKDCAYAVGTPTGIGYAFICASLCWLAALHYWPIVCMQQIMRMHRLYADFAYAKSRLRHASCAAG